MFHVWKSWIKYMDDFFKIVFFLRLNVLQNKNKYHSFSIKDFEK